MRSAKVTVAIRQMETGNNAGAIQALNDALADNPNDPFALALLATCLGFTRQFREAERAAAAALRQDAQSVPAHNAMALLAMQQQQMQRAERHLRTALELDPADEQATRNLAIVLRNTGRKREAEKLLHEARAVSPGSAGIVSDLAEMSYFAMRDREATELAEEALALQPDRPEALVTRGRLFMAQGKPGEARDFAVWALQRNPADREALELLVQVKAAQAPLMGLFWRFAIFQQRLIWRVRPKVPVTLTLVVFAIVFIGSKAVLVAFTNGEDIARPAIAVGFFLLLLVSLLAPQEMLKGLMRRELRAVKLRDDF